MAYHGVMILIGVAAWLSGGALRTVAAAEKETRVFNIKIDDRPAGYHQMTITNPDEHTFFVESRADVSVSYLVKKYKYIYQGTEEWKDGRLVQLKSQTNDDGKQFKVFVQAEGEKLRVQVNGKEYITLQDVWTTTYWHSPRLQSPNQSVALLDCDTGKVLRATVVYLGMQQLNVGGQTQSCAHYQIRGGEVHVDVWYDGQNRLVRQDALDDGHHVVLELTRIQR